MNAWGGDYTRAGLIILQLHGRTTAAVMEELNDVLHRAEAIVPDHLFPSLAALDRELLTPPQASWCPSPLNDGQATSIAVARAINSSSQPLRF